MENARDPIHNCAEAICDGLRQIGDFSYAILPRDIAHALGDLKKSFLTEVRNVVDWDIEWIGDRVAGGDKLREEWREKCRQSTPGDVSSEPSS
jgi:hypothetical protein